MPGRAGISTLSGVANLSAGGPKRWGPDFLIHVRGQGGPNHAASYDVLLGDALRQKRSSSSAFGFQIHNASEPRDIDETVKARRPRNHLVPLPIAYHPAHIFACHPAIAARSPSQILWRIMTRPRAVVLADILSELDQSARQARLYGQKAGGGHRLVDFRMPASPFFECRAADER